MSTGELIRNGGMEEYVLDFPTGWTTTTPGGVSMESAQGQVHTGDMAVALSNGADLSQIVPICAGGFYELSFFGHSENTQVGVTATVTFLSCRDGRRNSTIGLRIVANQRNIPNSNRDFGYYRGITTQAPAWATEAQITFMVTSTGGQYLDLDDVSFSGI